jgi:hypothetical protein
MVFPVPLSGNIGTTLDFSTQTVQLRQLNYKSARAFAQFPDFSPGMASGLAPLRCDTLSYDRPVAPSFAQWPAQAGGKIECRPYSQHAS